MSKKALFIIKLHSISYYTTNFQKNKVLEQCQRTMFTFFLAKLAEDATLAKLSFDVFSLTFKIPDNLKIEGN